MATKPGGDATPIYPDWATDTTGIALKTVMRMTTQSAVKNYMLKSTIAISCTFWRSMFGIHVYQRFKLQSNCILEIHLKVPS